MERKSKGFSFFLPFSSFLLSLSFVVPGAGEGSGALFLFSLLFFSQALGCGGGCSSSLLFRRWSAAVRGEEVPSPLSLFVSRRRSGVKSFPSPPLFSPFFFFFRAWQN